MARITRTGIVPRFLLKTSILVSLLIISAAVSAQSVLASFKTEAESGTMSSQAVILSDATASGGAYLVFSSAPPSTGLPFSASFENVSDIARFKYTVHHGVTPDQSITWLGDHNLSCGSPDTTRTVHMNTVSEQFYWCGAQGSDTGHVHTSMRTIAFAIVSFSPDQAFTNIHKICWDMSMQDIGGRRFPKVIVIPESTYQANGQRLDYVDGGNDIGENSAITINGQDFMLTVLRGSTATQVGQSVNDIDFSGFVNGTNKLRRFHHCITDNENGTVTLTLERSANTETRTMQGSIPNGPARVIFADHNYNPPKDTITTTDPNTIHWDNITIE